MLHLTWNVTSSGQKPIGIMLNISTELFPVMFRLSSHINTFLSRSVRDMYIESILEVTVPPNPSDAENLVIGCSIANQWRDSEPVIIRSSGRSDLVALKEFHIV